MGKIRFHLKHRVATLFRSVFHRRRSPAGYHRLEAPSGWQARPISRLFTWSRSLKNKAKLICSKNLGVGSGRRYLQLKQDPVEDRPVAVPKGYITVYVGQKDGDFERVLVPVIYFNHPLFGQLLREAEEEYGFNHPGGITLPCRISEFERVQTRIKQGRATGNSYHGDELL